MLMGKYFKIFDELFQIQRYCLAKVAKSFVYFAEISFKEYKTPSNHTTNKSTSIFQYQDKL